MTLRERLNDYADSLQQRRADELTDAERLVRDLPGELSRKAGAFGVLGIGLVDTVFPLRIATIGGDVIRPDLKPKRIAVFPNDVVLLGRVGKLTVLLEVLERA